MSAQKPGPIALAPLLDERQAERQDLPIPAPQWIEAPELRGNGERRLTRTASGILIGGAWSPAPPPPTADAEWLQTAMLARSRWAVAEAAAADDAPPEPPHRVDAFAWCLRLGAAIAMLIALGNAALYWLGVGGTR